MIAPNCRFQPIFVEDLAKAIALAALDPKTHGAKTYELGGPEVFAFKDLIKYTAAEVQSPRPLVWMPVAVARLIGLVGDVQAGLKGLVPVLPAPILTTDRVLLLANDNVVAKNAKGLKDLGIAATAVESIVPTYLWRFRKNGQFAVTA